ncbi:MAG: CRTAC1 family protein [Acidobacteriota bacterium]
MSSQPVATRWLLAGCALLLLAGCNGGSSPPGNGGATGGDGSGGSTGTGSSSSGSGGSGGGTPWFEDATAASGLDFQHVYGTETRYWFPELTGPGAGLFDADGDGDLDAYLLQSGDLSGPSAQGANVYFENLGDGSYVDGTARAGLGDRGYGQGCSVADADGDGDLDVHVTNVGPNVLYRNEGNGRFTDVSESARVQDPGWSLGSAFLDHDADGDLDLFVTNYLVWSIETDIKCSNPQGNRDYCGPKSYQTVAPDTLYRNDGELRFTDVSSEAGLRKAFGTGMGIACADFDEDGRLDVYVANDGRSNQLWMNRGGQFEDEALLRGCALNSQGQAEASMGVVAGDLDTDGDLDLFMTHLRGETNTVYLNNRGSFRDRSGRSKLGKSSLAFTGFGVALVDFDQDGNQDLYITNGRVMDKLPRYSEENVYAEPDLLYRGQGGGSFVEQGPRGGTAEERLDSGRGVAAGDVDGDGDIDLLVSNWGGPARLLKNVAASGHWLRVDPRRRDGNQALGAVVTLQLGDRSVSQLVQGSLSYCSASDPRAHFGLGATTKVDSITVAWPGGAKEAFPGSEVDRTLVLTEGGGA